MYILALVLLASPFYLNDFANIFIKDWHLWLFIDYVGVKLFPFVVTFWLIRSKKMQPAEFGLTAQRVPLFLIVFFVVTLLGAVIDQTGYSLIAALPGYSSLGGMPDITNPVWNWIDLTLGLLMVAIFEELVFRGFMYTFISHYTKNAFVIVVLSSMAFGFIHWSSGLHVVVITSIIGAMLMMVYLRTKSLPAIMLAHFAIDFIDFAGVIPKSIFKLV